MADTNALSNEQISDYRENGYLIVRDVLPPDDTVALRRIVEAQAACKAFSPSLQLPGTRQIHR